MFDKVVIATGFFSKQHIPDFPGLPAFRSNPNKLVLHSSEYRSPSSFTNQRVLVVGNAFSGADIAAELSDHASEVTVAMRRPVWVIPRRIGGKPLDLAFYRLCVCVCVCVCVRACACVCVCVCLRV